MAKYLISHDLGTSSNKASLFSTEGELIKSHTVPYEVHFFHKNYAEQDPEECTEQETEQIRQKVSQDIEQYNQSVPLYEQIQLLHFMNMPMEKTSLGKMIRPRFSCRSE